MKTMYARRFARRIAVAALLVAPAAVQAQSWTFVGVGEVGGDDVNLALVGASVHRGGLGWMPVASLQAYRVGYPSGSATEATYSVTPAVGLRYRADVGAFQAKVGYSFKSEDEKGESPAIPFFDGGSSGVSTSAQADFWGDGRFGVQGIGSYNWGSEYLWSRARGTVRLLGAESGSVHGGGEAVWQGDLADDPAAYRATQFGPVLQWVGNNGFIAVVGAGVKNVDVPGPSNGDDSTWYAKLELVLSR